MRNDAEISPQPQRQHRVARRLVPLLVLLLLLSVLHFCGFLLAPFFSEDLSPRGRAERWLKSRRMTRKRFAEYVAQNTIPSPDIKDASGNPSPLRFTSQQVKLVDAEFGSDERDWVMFVITTDQGRYAVHAETEWNGRLGFFEIKRE